MCLSVISIVFIIHVLHYIGEFRASNKIKLMEFPRYYVYFILALRVLTNQFIQHIYISIKIKII